MIAPVERFYFGHDLFELPRHVWGRWAWWARRHGIPTDRVLVPGWVERDPVSRRVAFLSCTCPPSGPHLVEHRRRPAARQLAEVPAPFPVPAGISVAAGGASS